MENVNVLLIEDDPLIRESLATLLEGWGAKVRRAEYFDAELAAQLIEEAPVDIIFSDFNLGPGRLTGLQSIFRIRSVLGRKIPAIISTATSRDAIMAQYEEETEGLDFADSAVNHLSYRSRSRRLRLIGLFTAKSKRSNFFPRFKVLAFIALY